MLAYNVKSYLINISEHNIPKLYKSNMGTLLLLTWLGCDKFLKYVRKINDISYIGSIIVPNP